MNLRKWWYNNRRGIQDIVIGFNRIMVRLADSGIRLMIIGIIINAVSTHFYPEFPERFPILYQWFDGWLQFGEFVFKGALGTIYSIFTGNIKEFFPKYQEAFWDLWNQAMHWLSTITF